MLKEISERAFSNRKLLTALIILNMMGFFAGMWAYYPQIAENPPHLWLIVLDCPIAVLLFAIICAFLLLRLEIPDALQFFTSVYLVKFAAWTMLVIALYWNYYLADEILGISTFLLHAGMVIEGIILIPRIRPKKYYTVIILALLLLNDYFDYFLGTHPIIPPEYVGFLMYESFAASIAITLSILLISKRKLTTL